MELEWTVLYCTLPLSVCGSEQRRYPGIRHAWTQHAISERSVSSPPEMKVKPTQLDSNMGISNQSGASTHLDLELGAGDVLAAIGADLVEGIGGLPAAAPSLHGFPSLTFFYLLLLLLVPQLSAASSSSSNRSREKGREGGTGGSREEEEDGQRSGCWVGRVSSNRRSPQDQATATASGRCAVLHLHRQLFFFWPV
jgi:hypothetical protein